jgi:D-alanyl-lipoteichoic acid acyltransferase DltB (MBOAT superfamily)
MPSIIFNTNRNNLDIVANGKYLPTFKEFIEIVLTFSLTVFAWIFFRAENISYAISYISKIFTPSLFYIPHLGKSLTLPISLLTMIFIIIEWIGREQQYAIAHIAAKCYKPF